MSNYRRKGVKLALLGLVMLTLLATALPGLAAPTVLYNARITTYYPNSTTRVYVAMDTDSKVLAQYKPGQAIQVTEVHPGFVGILYKGKTAYVLRHRIMDAEPLDKQNTPRFGTAMNLYYTTMDKTVEVKASPSADSKTLITMHEGAQLGFLDVQDGWARTIFKRQYGYVDTRLLGELNMVARNLDEAGPEVPIAVYNSFYSIGTDENIINRINNLKVGGERMGKVLQPGQTMDFNAEVGPFRASNGYLPAGALVDGEMVYDVYGGGSCQVSSTLYNVLLQLPDITVLRRAPHGPDGIGYLPHGVDASSGRLNLVFRNDHPFPVTIYTHVQDGSLFIAMYKVS